MMKNKIYMKLFSMIIFLIFTVNINASKWQWSEKRTDIIYGEINDNPTGLLWVPPSCESLNAIIISQQNMSEETLFENMMFRAEMEKAGVALLWITPGIDQKWEINSESQKSLDKLLDNLASKSGYNELRYTPVIPLGHSAMATFPWNYTIANPDRTLAVISLHGDAPRTNLTGYGRDNIDWGRRNIDGIPGIMIIGEFEWWEARVNPALAFRMVYPESCISFLMDGGRGHFDVSDKTMLYIAEFIKKSIETRLPDSYDGTSAPQLIKLNPSDGWLAHRWKDDGKKRPKPSHAASYKGDRHDAFWYFDKEMADMTEERYREIKNKKKQYIGITINDNKPEFNKETAANFSIDYDPSSDGFILNMKGFYTDSLRSKNIKYHSDKKIRFEKICGPVTAINDTTFRIEFFSTGFENKRRAGGIWLAACGDGDKNYNSTVQQIEIKIPIANNDGKKQTITFPEIKNIKKNIDVIPLTAFSDSGLPIEYYIKEGPASIKDGNIIINRIPVKAAFPLKVTVVAWQYGKKGDYSSADPVENSFYITE